MRINANVMAINSHRQLGALTTAQGKATEKLSSGFRINRAADDAAGLAISEKMRSQIRGMNQASRNAQDGISVVQTAEGALDEVHSMLQRMKELAVQSANDSNQSLVDREALQLEVDQLTDEINSITKKTQFNKMTLLDGTFEDKAFHVGANSNETINISIKSMTANGLGLNTGGSQELFQATGTTRHLHTTGRVPIQDAAKTIAADQEISPDFADITGIKPGAPAAEFRVVVNGKYETFTVEAREGKLHKDDLKNATLKALNKAAGRDDAFKIDGEKIKTNTELAAQSETTGANVKVTLMNESQLGIAQQAVIAKSAKDATLGTPEAARLELSHEIGEGYYEISVNGEKPKMVHLTKEDNTQAAIQAKFKAAFGDSVAVTWAVPNNGAEGVLTITSKAKGTNATLDIRATGEEGRKTVDYKGVNILTREAANKSMGNIQSAIETLASRRAELGAVQNRIEHTIKNLDNSAENLTAAESRIRHTDMAKEMMEFTRTNILNQAAQAMLAQANQLPQGVLQLLR